MILYDPLQQITMRRQMTVDQPPAYYWKKVCTDLDFSCDLLLCVYARHLFLSDTL